MTLPVSYSPSDSILCPCCHTVALIADCHVYPTQPARWRNKSVRHNPATVSISELEADPESYDFDDGED